MQDGISEAFALLQPAQPAEVENAPLASESVPVAPEVQALEAERNAAQAEVAKLRQEVLRRDLSGKVSDVEMALKVLDPEKHMNSKGAIDLNALCGEFPSLWPPGVTTPTAPDGGGGSQRIAAYDLNSALKTGNIPLINMVFEQELKRG